MIQADSSVSQEAVAAVPTPLRARPPFHQQVHLPSLIPESEDTRQIHLSSCRRHATEAVFARYPTERDLSERMDTNLEIFDLTGNHNLGQPERPYPIIRTMFYRSEYSAIT